jgi:glycerol-1-phosphatase
VQGYAPDISYSLLAEAAVAIRAGAWYVASNADATLPSSRGPLPGNGSLVQLIVTATGRQPVVAGKPEPPLHAEAVRRTGARRPLIVGDRLDTDIEGAVRAGADSMLVLTGVSQPADAVLAPPQCRPTYLAVDLTGLLEPHPDVITADGAFRCAAWTVRLMSDDGPPVPGRQTASARLEVSGSGQPIDGLRALCAAAWSAEAVTAEAVTAEMAHSAVGKLGFPAGLLPS